MLFANVDQVVLTLEATKDVIAAQAKTYTAVITKLVAKTEPHVKTKANKFFKY